MPATARRTMCARRFVPASGDPQSATRCCRSVHVHSGRLPPRRALPVLRDHSPGRSLTESSEAEQVIYLSAGIRPWIAADREVTEQFMRRRRRYFTFSPAYRHILFTCARERHFFPNRRCPSSAGPAGPGSSHARPRANHGAAVARRHRSTRAHGPVGRTVSSEESGAHGE